MLQVSRRIAEEVTRVDSEEVVLLRFFDIEKAYPRECRAAMWEVLRRRGCPEGMLKVLQGLHEHTAMKVRIYGGCSGSYVPDRGLREGCPSSPVLSNIFHDAVLQDYRIRRAELAEARGLTPGLVWDGKLCKRQAGRFQGGRGTGEVLLGDFGYADDTGICGVAEEVYEAEKLFTVVCKDWEEKVRPLKTEGLLRIAGRGLRGTDVANHGEAEAVKHVGGWVSAPGIPTIENNKRRLQVSRKMSAAARSWSFGGSGYRRVSNETIGQIDRSKSGGHSYSLSNSAYAILEYLADHPSRPILKSCLRRCWGIKQRELVDNHISGEMLRKAAGWPTTAHMVMKASLVWLGHIARMGVSRRPR